MIHGIWTKTWPAKLTLENLPSFLGMLCNFPLMGSLFLPFHLKFAPLPPLKLFGSRGVYLHCACLEPHQGSHVASVQRHVVGEMGGDKLVASCCGFQAWNSKHCVGITWNTGINQFLTLGFREPHHLGMMGVVAKAPISMQAFCCSVWPNGLPGVRVLVGWAMDLICVIECKRLAVVRPSICLWGCHGRPLIHVCTPQRAGTAPEFNRTGAPTHQASSWNGKVSKHTYGNALALIFITGVCQTSERALWRSETLKLAPLFMAFS